VGDSHDDGGVDWRRLASDRNVSHAVARGLWEHAHSVAPHDPVQAERAFNQLLDQAAVANVTHEPGRETLVDAKGPRDAASLGPGKVTRVLDENRSTGPAGTAPKSGKRSAEAVQLDLAAVAQAGKRAVEMLATSDPETIVAALRELQAQGAPGVLQKIMSVAGGAIERAVDAKEAKAGAKPSAPPPTTDKK